MRIPCPRLRGHVYYGALCSPLSWPAVAAELRSRLYGVENGDWLRAGINGNLTGKALRLGACPLFPRTPSVAARKEGQAPSAQPIATAMPIDRRSQSPFSGSSITFARRGRWLARIIHELVATFARTWGVPECYAHVLANVATTARHAIPKAMNNPG